MIRNYTDHAANERTFLAWLRTGVSIIAFGFVVEKFNIFLASLAIMSQQTKDVSWVSHRQLSQGTFTQYEGVVLMGLGVAVIGASAVRYVRTRKMISVQEQQPAPGVGPEMVLSITLTALTLAYCVHIFL